MLFTRREVRIGKTVPEVLVHKKEGTVFPNMKFTLAGE